MKKKIALILVLCAMVTMLCSCFPLSSYEEANINNPDDFSAGYFTTIKQWDGGIDYPFERIVYANDTGVMYYIFTNAHNGGITPLYNSDGTLQIWEGE